MTQTAEMKIASRYIPTGSVEIKHALGVAYAYQTPRGYAVVAYTGRAGKSCFHEIYGKVEARDKRITDFFSGLEAHEAQKLEFRAERNKPHTLKVGDILHHSWGWEQTNCDFYQVLSVTAHRATIQGIGDSTVEGSTISHGMADRRVAVPNSFHGEQITVKVDGTNHVCVSDGPLSHGSCSPWDGQPEYCSWYA